MTEEPEGSGRRREALGMHACSTLASSITQSTANGGPRVGGGGEGRQRKESVVMPASVLIFSSLARSNLKELVHLGSSQCVRIQSIMTEETHFLATEIYAVCLHLARQRTKTGSRLGTSPDPQ